MKSNDPRAKTLFQVVEHLKNNTWPHFHPPDLSPEPFKDVPLVSPSEIYLDNLLLELTFLWALYPRHAMPGLGREKSPNLGQALLKAFQGQAIGPTAPNLPKPHFSAFIHAYLTSLRGSDPEQASPPRGESHWAHNLFLDSRGGLWQLPDFSQCPPTLFIAQPPRMQSDWPQNFAKFAQAWPGGVPVFLALEWFEANFGLPTEQDIGTLFESLLEAEVRKKTGAYYTPPTICHKLSADLLGDYLAPIIGGRPPGGEGDREPELASSVIKWLEAPQSSPNQTTPQKLAQLHGALSQLRVLDPAVGAGHFLVAMAETILALYDRVWVWARAGGHRGAIALSRGPGAGDIDFADISESKALAALIQQQLVYPQILYGVDINPRATFIVKWRLFLKLHTFLPATRQAGIEKTFSQHVAFNVHVGNSLLGFRSWQAIPALQTGEKRSILASPVPRAVSTPDWGEFFREFRQFVDKFLDQPGYSQLFSSLAQFWELEAQIRGDPHQYFSFLIRLHRILRGALRRPLMTPLASGIARYSRRVASYLRQVADVSYHRLHVGQLSPPFDEMPLLFHWALEFPEIFGTPPALHGFLPPPPAPSGFHIVIGNPPYGDLLSKRAKALLEGGLGAASEVSSLFISQAAQLTAYSGSFGYITSYTICFHKKLSALRHSLMRQFSTVLMATFDRDKCRLFDNMTQSVTLLRCRNKIPGTRSDLGTLLTTPIYREKPELDRLEYGRGNEYLLGDSIGVPFSSAHRVPKIGGSPLRELLVVFKQTFSESHRQIGGYIQSPHICKTHADFEAISAEFSGSHAGIWVRISGNYWYNAWDRPPYYGTQIAYLPLQTADPLTQAFLLALINSSVYYAWFRVYSDGRHMNTDILRAIPIPVDFSRRLRDMVPFLGVYSECLMDRLFTHFEPARNRFRTSEMKNFLDVGDMLIGYIYQLSPELVTSCQNLDPTVRGGKQLQEALQSQITALFVPLSETREIEPLKAQFRALLDQII